MFKFPIALIDRRDINNRRRRSSAGVEDKDLIKKIEREYEEPPIENPSLVYNRLSVKILKYRFLHKVFLHCGTYFKY